MAVSRSKNSSRSSPLPGRPPIPNPPAQGIRPNVDDVVRSEALGTPFPLIEPPKDGSQDLIGRLIQ